MSISVPCIRIVVLSPWRVRQSPQNQAGWIWSLMQSWRLQCKQETQQRAFLQLAWLIKDTKKVWCGRNVLGFTAYHMIRVVTWQQQRIMWLIAVKNFCKSSCLYKTHVCGLAVRWHVISFHNQDIFLSWASFCEKVSPDKIALCCLEPVKYGGLSCLHSALVTQSHFVWCVPSICQNFSLLHGSFKSKMTWSKNKIHVFLCHIWRKDDAKFPISVVVH